MILFLSAKWVLINLLKNLIHYWTLLQPKDEWGPGIPNFIKSNFSDKFFCRHPVFIIEVFTWRHPTIVMQPEIYHRITSPERCSTSYLLMTCEDSLVACQYTSPMEAVHRTSSPSSTSCSVTVSCRLEAALSSRVPLGLSYHTLGTNWFPGKNWGLESTLIFP